MKTVTAYLPLLRFSAAAGLALTMPFMLLEWINRRGFGEAYPYPLFVILWLLSFAFILMLRLARVRNRRQMATFGFWLGAACLSVLAVLWVGIVQDQMPCFLGVPLCD